MPEFKERPKGVKPKTRPTTAAPPRQAARLMVDKYRQQLDQRPEGADTEAANYATDKVEGMGRRTADEVVSHRPRPRQERKNPLKKKPDTGSKSDLPKEEPPQADPQKPKQRPTSRPKEREAVTPKTKQQAQQKAANGPGGQAKAQAQRKAVNAIKERKTAAIKERTAQAEPKPTQPHGQAVTRIEDKKAMLAKTRQSQALGQRPMVEAPQTVSPPPGRSLASGTAKGSNAPKTKPRRASAFKERPGSAIKTRSTPTVKKSSPLSRKAKPAARGAKKAAKNSVQRQMTQRMVAQAQRAAKATMNAAKKAAEVAVRAVAAMISGLVGLLGGGVLLALLLLVAIVAAVASSPFGIFFAGGDGGGSSTQPTVSVAEAVGQINMEYNTKLETLQAGGYDSIDVTGAAPEWPDVLASFASRYAAADDGVDVATLDADRVSKLTSTFWDMTSITSYVQSIHHPGTPQEDGTTTGGWTEHILHITITAKTAEDMKTQYNLNDFQKDAMNELLSDRAALSSLAGSLDIANADALTVLRDLPADLSPDRHKAVQTALQLVGKVNYFWGGKSYVIGWDSRWGQLSKVTSAGSPSTGTFRPYGLDCTGFVDWTLRNAGLPSDGHWFIGSNLTEVTQAQALPGDIALYPDASHVGMVVGRDSSGRLLICHCSSGHNNVVITEYAASGFTALGRPAIYTS